MVDRVHGKCHEAGIERLDCHMRRYLDSSLSTILHNISMSRELALINFFSFWSNAF